MLTHDQVWAAIDALAHRHGLTVSGLARKGGLDPTTFNRSKRVGSDGRQRWPSTESLAKILEATNASLDDFIELLRPPSRAGADNVAAAGFAEAAAPQYGPVTVRASRPEWEEEAIPMIADDQAEIVQVIGDQLEPVYRRGAYLVASRSVPRQIGDRLLVRSTSGALLVRQLAGEVRGRLSLTGWNPALPDCALAAREIDWIAKVVWATQ